MSEIYDNAYAPDNVYGHAVALLQSRGVGGPGIHLDFGCGYGRMAEVIRAMGLRYIGLDVDELGLAALKQRGFEVMFVDLRDPDRAFEEVTKYLPTDAAVVSMSMLDTLEHLAEPAKALRMLRNLAVGFSCPLIVSVPNFTHRDVGFRAAFGKLDYTHAGLLDHTHLQYFTEKRIADVMASGGWHEIAAKDVRMRKSDQAFPRDHAALAATPLHALLAQLRGQADPSADVNQFVRMYLAGHVVNPAPPADSIAECAGVDDVFLTVVTRTQGRRVDTLRETLLCLSAQTCQDFEVCIVGHDLDLDGQLAVERLIADLHDGFRNRVHLVRVTGGSRATPLNRAFECARGRYVAMLDDDDLVFGNWVETFKALSKENGGRLLRSVAVAQSWDKVKAVGGARASRAIGGMQSIYAEEFDLLMHLIENRSPLHSLAFPRSLFTDMGYRFDDYLTTAEDWDFIIRVAPIAGVAGVRNVTCIYRRWVNAENSFSIHSEDEWRHNYYYTLRKLDNAPFLMPVGATRRLRELLYELERLRTGPATSSMPYSDPSQLSVELEQERYLEALRWRYHELVNSTSWKVTAPLRAIVRLARREDGTRSSSRQMLWRLSARDLEYLVSSIESSRSWRITSFLRGLKRG